MARLFEDKYALWNEQSVLLTEDERLDWWFSACDYALESKSASTYRIIDGSCISGKFHASHTGLQILTVSGGRSTSHMLVQGPMPSSSAFSPRQQVLRSMPAAAQSTPQDQMLPRTMLGFSQLPRFMPAPSQWQHSTTEHIPPNLPAQSMSYGNIEDLSAAQHDKANLSKLPAPRYGYEASEFMIDFTPEEYKDRLESKFGEALHELSLIHI